MLISVKKVGHVTKKLEISLLEKPPERLPQGNTHSINNTLYLLNKKEFIISL